METSTTVRNTASGLLSRHSPEPCSRSARLQPTPVGQRLIERRRPHHQNTFYTVSIQRRQELTQRLGVAAHFVAFTESDPATGPPGEIERAYHQREAKPAQQTLLWP
ncbi:MAG: hypothetical protein ACSLE8_06755 [Rhodococcus sp. (in: high G+C Gram-positive bacteria)]